MRVFKVTYFFLFLLSLTAWGIHDVTAEEEEPPKRQTTIFVSFIEYEWWLIRWEDNQVACQIFVDHEGVPDKKEVLSSCGKELYEEWEKTPACEVEDIEDGSITSCLGMYLHQVSQRPAERSVAIDLPIPTVWVTLSGCLLEPPGNICENIPSLLLSGEEILPNEHITAIHYTLGENTFTCEADVCEIPLSPTPLQGMEVEFWVDSSFGDSSEHFIALVRVLDSGVLPSPISGNWYVDVLSSQWRGGPVESCAQVWQAFPPAGDSPRWLSTPPQMELLETDEPYFYLAGRLIDHSLVDASECPSDGLLANGYANACGLEKATPMVTLWQNQFDNPIFTVAIETGLPAYLMKNLFAQESQFWPGVFRVAEEFGFGQLTDMGADTILLWNSAFFDQFCPLVLFESVCAEGYLHLEEEESAILRGALALQANADCEGCPTGIDLIHADFSVMLFAQSILANCDQVGQTVYNATNSVPGSVSSYEDLWRFTLANYHVGSGCLSYTIHTAWQQQEPLTWEYVSSHFTEPCQSAVPYVDLIAR